jgi:hypothetical protein
MPHKFKVGQEVAYHSRLGHFAPRGPYVVTAALPALDSEFQYRIKHPKETHGRAVGESELTAGIRANQR